jgi:hypothetical protein
MAFWSGDWQNIEVFIKGNNASNKFIRNLPGSVPDDTDLQFSFRMMAK